MVSPMTPAGVGSNERNERMEALRRIERILEEQPVRIDVNGKPAELPAS